MRKTREHEQLRKEALQGLSEASPSKSVSPMASVRKAAKRINSAAKREASRRQAILQGSAQYDGNVDSIDRTVITGWAWDQRQPRVSIALDILDGERLIGTVFADERRDDLKSAGIGDGYHAFSFEIPGEIADGDIHLIDIRFAGTGLRLNGAPLRVSIAGVADRNPSSAESADRGSGETNHDVAP